MPALTSGASTYGGSVAKPCGATRARSPWCSWWWIRRAGPSSADNFSRRNERVVEGPFVGCPGHLCATHFAGYLNFATTAGAMAIHGHSGGAVVPVTRGAADAWAHC